MASKNLPSLSVIVIFINTLQNLYLFSMYPKVFYTLGLQQWTDAF